MKNIVTSGNNMFQTQTSAENALDDDKWSKQRSRMSDLRGYNCYFINIDKDTLFFFVLSTCHLTR